MLLRLNQNFRQAIPEQRTCIFQLLFSSRTKRKEKKKKQLKSADNKSLVNETSKQKVMNIYTNKYRIC